MKTYKYEIRTLPAVFILSAVLLAAMAGNARADQAIWATTAQSTVLIQVPTVGYGSGVLIDATHRLVITAAHVVGQKTEASVIFAQRDSAGRIITHAGHYADNEAKLSIKARVLRVDKAHDLAVLQLDSLPAGATAMSLATESPTPGEAAHVVGNSSLQDGVLFRYSTGHVGSVNGKAGFFETSVPANKGDSGGPVVNSRSEVIGLVSFRDLQRTLVKFDIDIHPIRTLVDAARSELMRLEVKRFAEAGRFRRQKAGVDASVMTLKMFGFSPATNGSQSARILAEKTPANDDGATTAAKTDSPTTANSDATNPTITAIDPTTNGPFKTITEIHAKPLDEARQRAMWSNQKADADDRSLGEKAWGAVTDIIGWLLAHPLRLMLAIIAFTVVTRKGAKHAA